MIEYMNHNKHCINNAMKEMEPEEAHSVGCVSAAAYVCMFIFGLLLCALLGSCKSQKKLINEKEQKDSVRVDVRYQTIIVPDTVYVEIPPHIAESTTADSTSHLENGYSTSDARINPDGTLFHKLATKPQKKPVEVYKKIEHRDSIVYVEKSNTETGQQIVEVERKLSWWEKTRIYGFYLLASMLVVIYRKPIWSLLRKFILRMPP